MPVSTQRRQWSAFVLVVGLVLIGLCALAASGPALVLGVALTFAGLVGLLVR